MLAAETLQRHFYWPARRSRFDDRCGECSRLPLELLRSSRTLHGQAYGVFDGHGEKGHLISEYCKHSLTRSVGTASKEPEDAMIPRVEARCSVGFAPQLSRGGRALEHLSLPQ